MNELWPPSLQPDDDLVDIGRGDGTLLPMSARIGCRSATGWLAPDKEVALPRRHGLETKQASAHALPLPDASASVVVCNNVLLIVPRDTIQVSQQEIFRIAKPGARSHFGGDSICGSSGPTHLIS